MTVPSLTARLFVTDVQRAIPLRGETRVEQAENYKADITKHREMRLFAAATQFHSLVMAHLPARQDEHMVATIQSEIARMVAAGDLYAGRMGEMLASVGYAKGGTVRVAIVDQWGNEVEL
jgi:hypothetical protein